MTAPVSVWDSACEGRTSGPFLTLSTLTDPEGRWVLAHCSQRRGHDGPHFIHVEWDDSSASQDAGSTE